MDRDPYGPLRKTIIGPISPHESGLFRSGFAEGHRKSTFLHFFLQNRLYPQIPIGPYSTRPAHGKAGTTLPTATASFQSIPTARQRKAPAPTSGHPAPLRHRKLPKQKGADLPANPLFRHPNIVYWKSFIQLHSTRPLPILLRHAIIRVVVYIV